MPEFLREMNSQAFQKYGDIMTVGEAPNCKTKEEALQYVRSSDPMLSMAFNFDIIVLTTGAPTKQPKHVHTPYKLSEFKALWANIQDSIEGTDAWITAFLENHDFGRSISRFGDDSPENWEKSCKVLATLLVTATGTLFVYQGQEIGMSNAPSSWNYDEFPDVELQNYLKELKEKGSKFPESVPVGVHKQARDHARLPMQWDSSPNAGFSDHKPWMRVHDKYKEVNVAAQEQDPTSVLNFWRELLKIRKEYRELFAYGDFHLLDRRSEHTFVIGKSLPGSQKGPNLKGPRALISLNFTGEARMVEDLYGIGTESAKLVSCNYPPEDAVFDELRPWESRIYILD